MKKLFVGAILVALVAVFAPAKPAKAQGCILSHIDWFATNFCPRDWQPASGQLIAISQNQALFSLLGTTYGGDGRTTFALPDLRGRSMIGVGTGPGRPSYRLGAHGGATSVTQTSQTLAPHTHDVTGSVDGSVRFQASIADSANPAGGYLAIPNGPVIFSSDGTSLQDMAAGSINGTLTAAAMSSGGGYAMNIQDPYLAMTACICFQGYFPSRN